MARKMKPKLSEQGILLALFKMARLGALKKFHNNCRKYHVYRDGKEYLRVAGSFPWARTPQGNNYWYRISESVD